MTHDGNKIYVFLGGAKSRQQVHYSYRLQEIEIQFIIFLNIQETGQVVKELRSGWASETYSTSKFKKDEFVPRHRLSLEKTLNVFYYS